MAANENALTKAKFEIRICGIIQNAGVPHGRPTKKEKNGITKIKNILRK